MTERTGTKAAPGAARGARGGRARARSIAALGVLLAPLVGIGLLGGCAVFTPTAGEDEDGAGVPPAEAAMLEDLALALEQLHEPRTTTVQVTREADPLTTAFVERLAAAGYGIQRVDADQGPRHLTLIATEESADDGAPELRLELEVGVTELGRSYVRRDDGARPASPLSVGGTRADVALDDSRFGPDVDARHERVLRVGAAAAPERLPLISLITEDVVRGVAREATRGPSLAAVNSQRVEVSNLYFGDQAFGSLGDDWAPAERTVVIFANDSLRLGPDGKRRIARFVESYREGEDLIGLIGCSNGPTALEIGNEGLALGRSRRVAEELVALGIARERIVDEGCWAPTSAGDRFPSRGVVMEILRKPS